MDVWRGGGEGAVGLGAVALGYVPCVLGGGLELRGLDWGGLWRMVEIGGEGRAKQICVIWRREGRGEVVEDCLKCGLHRGLYNTELVSETKLGWRGRTHS